MNIAGLVLMAMTMTPPGIGPPADVQIDTKPMVPHLDVSANVDRASREQADREQRYRSTIENAIRAKLLDPDSAKFEWPYGFVYRGWGREEGYMTCGHVNARNRFGGYVGRRPFVVLVHKDGTIGSMNWADDDRNSFWVEVECKRLARGLPAAN